MAAYNELRHLPTGAIAAETSKQVDVLMKSGLTTRLCGVGLLLFHWLILLPLAAQDGPADGEHTGRALYEQAALIHFNGPITSRLEQYVYRKTDKARASGADLLIIQMDSPGGELEASLRLANYFRDLDWAYTVAYVPQQALSGAAIAALGCNEIVLRPQAVFGDAGPIVMDYMEFGFRHAPEKVQTDLARRVRDLAAKGDRPPALAEAMVDKDLIVHRVRHQEDGRERYMSEEEIAADTDSSQWEKINEVLESRAGKFLEVSGTRAVELGMADANVDHESELIQRYNLAKPPHVLHRQFADFAVDLLNSPWVTALLLVVGLVALYIEFAAPGVSVGGLTAVLCFTLFFWSRFLGGTAGWLEVILFVAGVVFVIVELFVIPGFGVAGMGGFLLIVISLVMAGQNFLVPETASEMRTLTRTLLVIAGSGVLVIAGAVATTWYLDEIPILGRLALRPPDAQLTVTDSQPHYEEYAGLPPQQKKLRVGDVGLADSPLRPAGVARFGDDFHDVVSEGNFVEDGRRIKVIHLSGNRIVVRDIDDAV